MIPRRKKSEKHGLRQDTRDQPQHRAWIRGHECAVTTSPCATDCFGKIQAAHVRLGLGNEAGGTGMKPHDKFCIPLCSGHHQEQHNLGEATFAKNYRIDPLKIARALAEKSPHRHRWEENRLPQFVRSTP